MSADYQTLPVDERSAQRLAEQNLRLGLVDTADEAAFTTWIEAEARGFHGGLPTPESLDAQVRALAHRRSSGVWDASAADANSPISTVSSWPTELTVPGATSVTAWAISAVTVAPTHRRRGVARAMLEAELRTAHRLGCAVAMLTVSEATIYSRYGFAPAAMMADWTVNARRAQWTGPTPAGRVQFVPLEQLLEDGLALVERVRLDVPGQIKFSGLLWERLLGFAGTDPVKARKLRAVRFDDADGVAQGFAVYRVTETEASYESHVVDIDYLVAATDDAYAALWRYLLEIDLVSEVRAPLRPVAEAFAWQISDYRSARKSLERDHLWTRILDVKSALEGRRYRSAGQIVLEVTDPLGFADGRVLLRVDSDGAATVSALTGEIPDGMAAVALSVNELSALYLGGVSGVTLARAGRVTEVRDGSAAVLDSLFQSTVAPWLSIWF